MTNFFFPMNSKLTRAILTTGVFGLMAFVFQTDAGVIRSAQIWPDTAGHHINAHCGHILQSGGIYYWFGENRTGDRRQVTCYASTNLQDWTAISTNYPSGGAFNFPDTVMPGSDRRFYRSVLLP